MVLTNNQTTSFFEDANQMALPGATRIQLQVEGINLVDDLAEFDKETIDQIATNLRNPGGRVPNPDPNAGIGATIPTPPFVFGARSKMRILAACDLILFYNMIGRDLTAGAIHWDPVIKNFVLQWKALEDRRKADNPEVPKITKTLNVIKWSEAFADFLHRKIGVRKIPLAYVVREAVAVPNLVPDRANNMPHTTAHGSVEADMVARASHNHPLFRDDNAEVYYDLEEATQGTSYAASIKPYQRRKDGRGAFLSLIGQYAGEDKWEAEFKKQDELLHTRVWKGQSNFSLEKYIAQHRNAYISMQQCVEHVQRQLPNERTRVTYLLDGIQCGDAELQASMALVRNDNAPTGKINDFEATASFLLPSCPIARKRRAQGGLNKRTNADISEVAGSVLEEDSDDEPESEGEIEISEVKAKAKQKKLSKGKTGVEFRFYKHNEFRELSDEQKTELLEWRESKKRQGGGSGTKPGQSQQKKWIAAAVERRMEAKERESVEDEDLKKYLMGVISGMSAGPTNQRGTASASEATAAPQTEQQPKRVTLASILRKAKSGS